ncbi:MAG: trigger factor [Desulfobacteraceae bacterium]|nr:trigger factor [Desulfobacteraceae bacterium]MBC2750836.1 trigger factor [Desulfobacteraceae bacterium]
MNFSVEDQSAVKKKLTIEVPLEDVTRELDNAYKELKKNAKVKGFRPGKTPRSVLERLYGKDVRADVSSRLIQDSFIEVLKESEMNVVGMPDIDPPELKAGEAFTFVATVEVNPELENYNIDGFQLKKTLYRATDEEVDAQLQMLRNNLARMVPIEEDRPVADGDYVVVDYEGLKDGKPFAETQRTENFSMKIGDGMIHPDIDAGLIGLKAGESTEVSVQFADDYFNEKLAGLAITFLIDLKEIREQHLPEIDDEMAKRLGQFESLDDLKAKINENLAMGYTKRQEQELNEQVFTALLDQQEFEVPESMVAHELENIVAEAKQKFAYHNTSMEELGLDDEQLNTNYRETAVNQVRRHMILGKIISQESLAISDEELESGYQEMADSFNQPVDVIKQFYAQNPERIDVFKHALLEKQAIKLIMDKSSIEEVEPELETPAEDDKTE